MTDDPDLTLAELVEVGRGHAVDLGLVEAADRTLHFPQCRQVNGPPSHPQRIPLEAIDSFPLCEWCVLQLKTPSLGAVVRLASDISAIAQLVQAPSAAWAVAVDGLAQIHRSVVCEFHPALAAFGRSQHLLNDQGIVALRAALRPETPSGQSLRRSALRIAVLEAGAAVALGRVRPGGGWDDVVGPLIEAGSVSGRRLAAILLTLADWEALRVVARPICQREWTHVADPPPDRQRRLVTQTGLDPTSLEALAVELVVDDLLDHLHSLDLSQLDVAHRVPVRIDVGPTLSPASRELTWRRGRIHWLRGLIDLGTVGETVGEGAYGNIVGVPPIVAAALHLPRSVAGTSPARAAMHHVVDGRAA